MDHEQRAVLAIAQRSRSADSISALARPAAGSRNSRAVQLRADQIPPPDVPAEALDDRIVIVGTAGSGKTYAAKGFVERLIDSGARVTVVDPLGVWWGLRASADGAAPGYPVIVFGGRHADVPITADMGAALGRIVAREALACVVDLSELGSSAARRRFMVSFCETLYESNEEPLHLVLDEADLWAPQRPIKGWESLLSHIEEIVRRGRARTATRSARGSRARPTARKASAFLPISRGCNAAKRISGLPGTASSTASPSRRSARSTARARRNAANASPPRARLRK
jgi:hypothetical protein